jgi:nucleolar protein 56
LEASINEALGAQSLHTGVVPEIVRGIRHHYHNMVKGFTLQTSGKAQLGLGHSYSRAKVKFNVNRVDNMTIQSIALLDQLDKDVNIFAMRISASLTTSQSLSRLFLTTICTPGRRIS